MCDAFEKKANAVAHGNRRMLWQWYLEKDGHPYTIRSLREEIKSLKAILKEMEQDKL